MSEPLAPFIDRISDLMARAPGQDEADVLALTFADLERQLASVGVPRPAGEDLPDGFLAATEALPLTSGAFQFALMPEWWETFGLEPLQVGRTLQVGEPPHTVTIFAGGIDPERVRTALLAAGYQEIDQEPGESYLTFGDDFSPDTTVGRLGVGSMNQAVIRDDAAIFTYRESTIRKVAQVIAGHAPSMLEQGGWPDLMTTFSPDIVGVMGAYPAILSDLGDVAGIRQLALGVREGADNRNLQEAADASEERQVATAVVDMEAARARVEVRIRYENEAMARSESEAIPERWSSMSSVRTGQPLTELMLVEDARISEGDPTVAAIDLRVQGAPGWWADIVLARDLAPFVPASE